MSSFLYTPSTPPTEQKEYTPPRSSLSTDSKMLSSPLSTSSNNSSSPTFQSFTPNRTSLTRPLAHLSSPTATRASRQKKFQNHLRDQRERVATLARGGEESMMSLVLRSEHERAIAKLEEEARQYQVNPDLWDQEEERQGYPVDIENDQPDMETVNELLELANRYHENSDLGLTEAKEGHPADIEPDQYALDHAMDYSM